MIIKERDGEFDGDMLNDALQILGDFYATLMIGLGGILEINSGDDERFNGSKYTAEASVFFTPYIGVAASSSIFKHEVVSCHDYNSFEIAVKGRF